VARSLVMRILTYVPSNRSVIVEFAKRYRAGPWFADMLTEWAVKSRVRRRMVRQQRMRW
jgi:hypothetical protein